MAFSQEWRLKKMKVYIASRYFSNKDVNRTITKALIENGFDVFLPETINVNAIDLAQMMFVAETCYKEIDNSDVVLFVYPFGKSVACEFGYAISRKRMNKNLTIVSYSFMPDNEAMYTPYIDKNVNTIFELIEYLNTIRK